MFHFLPAARIAAWVALPAAVVLAASPALAATGWTVVTSPPTGDNGYLLAVSADSTTNAWAVGTVNRTGADPGPLTDHWNGTAWSQATPPSYPTTDTVSLDAVSAASSTDAWAAGFTKVGTKGEALPATAHWNGTSWSVVTPAECTTGGATVASYLLGVADVSPTEAFTVGECTSQATGYIEQWNGSAWSMATLPDPNTTNPGMTKSLSAISADSATDVWAVGEYTIVYTPTGIRYEPYSLHWNGSTWSVVAMPPVPGTDGQLVYQFNAIDAISPTNVWAVGDSGDDVGVGGSPTATLIEHYNGTSWSVVSSPAGGTTPYLNGVAAESSTDVWAVGYTAPSGSTGAQTLTMNWNGTAWSTVSSPDVGSSSLLVGVSSTPGGPIWAAGYSGTSGAFNPLMIQHS